MIDDILEILPPCMRNVSFKWILRSLSASLSICQISFPSYAEFANVYSRIYNLAKNNNC